MIASKKSIHRSIKWNDFIPCRILSINLIRSLSSAFNVFGVTRNKNLFSPEKHRPRIAKGLKEREKKVRRVVKGDGRSRLWKET